MNQVSIVIPTYNEKGTIEELIQRIKNSFYKARKQYEIIFIDDFSNDGTYEEIEKFADGNKVKLFSKNGKKGKSFSLLQGFKHAKYPAIAMIDADLQYPPEAIPQMTDLLQGSGVIVSERTERKVSIVRKITSASFSKVFGKFLHGIDTDIQSGLKVFRKEIIERIELHPTKWTFDLEFLVNAKDAGYKIKGYKIQFGERKYGKSKVSIINAIFEIGYSAVKLKLKPKKIIHSKNSLLNGFHHNGVGYKTYNQFREKDSAFLSTTKRQKKIFFGILIFFLIFAFFNFKLSLITAFSLLTSIYLMDILFYFFLTIRSMSKIPEISISENELENLPKELPLYTILCPLYKEWHVAKQFIQAIEKLDYPKEKLQVLLLLEEDDTGTIEKINEIKLPDYFEKIIVPNSLPKTKPKACNYGLLYAKGEYSVIYDAEDIPEKDQLLKVIATFGKLPEKTVCVQAKLNFYNSKQNFLTSLFTSEYSLWFDLILPGLQSLEAPIPLGGTSNHFKTSLLKKMNGWDAFNVTEDCDLGIRLSNFGYQTAIVDSTTYEEANSDPKNWFGQRTRWIKGYIQTFFVHTRSNQQKSFKDSVLFQLVVGGKIFLLFVNPFMWAITASYFIFRPVAGPLIESFYPTPVLYLGVISLVFGNFLHLYSYMIGCAKRGQYELIPLAFFVPIYWLMMSMAAWVALYKFIRQPHYWFKTLHGLHFKSNNPSTNPALSF